eukprot:gene9175-10766_t
MSLGAIGIIYGDIGTSPLYVFSSMFTHGPPTQSEVLGALSLILWALILVVCIKYVIFVLAVDNNGEGGIMALQALVPPNAPSWMRTALTVVAVIGAALILGDGVITPAISVLSAIEGLEVGIHNFESYVMPITLVILVLFFISQSFGTARLGKFFGPIMLLWFVSIGVFGAIKIADNPVILKAFNPWEGMKYLGHGGSRGFLSLGTVILCVTGVEAMYADLGHFGSRPVRISWFIVVLPSLMLNYLGQGSLYLSEPNVENSFYRVVPKPLFWPMIVLATLATIIASQALISGAFSIVNQAMCLNCFPRVKVHHTSNKQYGQVYISEVNYTLMIITVAVVVGFRHSKNLISAYGLGVSSVMVLTTIMYLAVIYYHLHRPLWVVILLGAFFLILDLAFFTSCLVKIPTGGWFPIAVALVLSFIMLVWRYGRRRVSAQIRQISPPLDTTLAAITNWHDRCAGAVFLADQEDITPLSIAKLQPFLTYMPYPLFFLSVHHLPVPFIAESHRVIIREVIPSQGVFQVVVNYGYSEISSLTHIINQLALQGAFKTDRLITEPAIPSGCPDESEDSDYIDFNAPTAEASYDITFFLTRVRTHSTSKNIFLQLISRVFEFLLQNSRTIADTYGINTQLVVEVGSQLDIAPKRQSID